MNKLFLLIAMICLSACSTYKTSWDCKNQKGIGCSSMEYADEIARKRIILNINKGSTNKGGQQILLKEHYSDMDRVPEREIELQ